ncbi:MAG TPA: NADH-quinone oxidoreductase subunit J, partial [Trueperaceae bacterium]|nr:NADH-quinone oxidoreductase subunit J [Trueperaceae bacterium]
MITFLILAAVMVAGAIGVITLRQPIHAALALVGTLLALAVAYVTLEAHFLGAIQVIVYAGAIMVLFLFVIMLLNVERQRPAPRWPWLRPTAIGVGLLGAAGIAAVAFTDSVPLPAREVIADVLQGGSAERIGTVLFSDYLLAFHLVGVLLLTGIIAAVSLVQRGGPA